ncbi:MAG: integration host factor subunit beta [Endomicrobiales bacterium]|nr:integration host factor subunit beta [Endomicrobiales bacterium]
MNKMDLIESLTKVLSTRKEAKDALEKIFSEMKRALRDGDKVVISNFGSFHPFTQRSKKCRNPKTGQAIQIPPRKKVRFHQSKELF